MRGGRKYISKLESVIPKISRNVEQTHENMVHSRVCSFGGSCLTVSGYREQHIKCKVCNLVFRYTLDVHRHGAAQCRKCNLVCPATRSTTEVVLKCNATPRHCGAAGARCSQLVPAVRGSCPSSTTLKVRSRARCCSPLHCSAPSESLLHCYTVVLLREPASGRCYRGPCGRYVPV